MTSYSYPSVWLLQPLFYENDSTTDWALNDNWLPLLHVLHLLNIFTCQVNCTASHRYQIFAQVSHIHRYHVFTQVSDICTGITYSHSYHVFIQYHVFTEVLDVK